MRTYFIILFSFFAVFSFGQTCKDSAYYKFMDLSVCLDPSIEIVAYEKNSVFVGLVEKDQDRTKKQKVVQIRAAINAKNKRPIDIWAKEHEKFILSAKQVSTVLDTTYKINGRDFYWNESLAQMGEQKYFMVYTGILFENNQYYLLKIGGSVEDENIKKHILHVAENCHILPTGIMEEDFTLQKNMMDEILLSVQNEKRLENITLNFDLFYQNLPVSEQNEESKEGLKKMVEQWTNQTKIYLRGMRQFEEVKLLYYNFQPEKTDPKMTVYNGELVFELDKKIFRAKAAFMKIDHKIYLMAINGEIDKEEE